MTSNCMQQHRAAILVVPPSLLANSGAANADPGKTRPTGINCGGFATSKTGEVHRARHRISDPGARWPDDLNTPEEFATDERRTTDDVVAGGAGPLRGRDQVGT